MYSLKPPRRNQTRKGEKSLSLKMVTVRKKMMDGEEMKICSLRRETDRRVLCRRGTNFLLLKWPNTPNFITIIFTKKN